MSSWCLVLLRILASCGILSQVSQQARNMEHFSTRTLLPLMCTSPIGLPLLMTMNSPSFALHPCNESCQLV